MKFHTTKKAIMNGYKNVICVPYCALQSLLSHENAIAYTTRVEGWGADVYQFGNTAIVTGYAPFGNIRPGYEINKKYDDRAQSALPEYYNDLNNSLVFSDIITKYIEEVTGDNE